MVEDRKKKIKSMIETLINNNKLIEAKLAIKDYGRVVPNDIDIYSILGVIYILENKLDDAKEILLEGLVKDEFNFDINYNLAYIAELENNESTSYYFYKNAYEVCKEKNIKQQIKDKLDKIVKYDKNVIIKNFSNRNPNILMVGSGCHYADSIKYLLDRNWKVFVLKTDTYKAFYGNYSLLKSMGAKIIEKNDVNEFINNEGCNIDVIFRTGYFYGGNELYRNLGMSDIVQINTFNEVAKKIKNQNKNAIAILAFDGDTFLTDNYWINWLNKKIEICDYIFADTDNLKHYIAKITNYDIKNIYKFRFEFPNKKDIYINRSNSKKYSVLHIGRYLGDYIPVANIFINKFNENFQLGRGDNIKTMINDRMNFAKKYSSDYFGLGHFYDFYKNNLTFYQLLNYNDLDIVKSNIIGYNYPAIYGFTNIAGKIITYLQFGIIPIIPNNDNDYHKELIDKRLAIGIKKNQYFFDPFDYSESFLRQINESMTDNFDMFTSDPTYQFLIKLVNRINLF